MLLSHISKIFKKTQFLFFVFVSFVALTLTLLLSTTERCLANTYYAATDGNDGNSGSLSEPWRTLKNSIPKLRPGDILYLRNGIYYENNIVVNVTGTEPSRITISNYPGETPIIDGGYTEFRNVPNVDWEVYDTRKNIYRSIRTYSRADTVFGFLGADNGNYRLVSYRKYTDLSSDNQTYVKKGNLYVGPGVFWNRSDSRIYVRLVLSQMELNMGYNVPPNTDPRQTAMYLFPTGILITIESSASYVTFDGIDFKHSGYIFDIQSFSHDITIKNSNILGGNYHIVIREGSHDITFDSIYISDSFPHWVSWTDVKNGTMPAERIKSSGIDIVGAVYNVEIKNSTIKNTFDAIDAAANPHDIHIHHNVFSGIRDDVLQLGSAGYNIEVNNNKITSCFTSVSWNGSGESLKPGTKYIHHNIIDVSTPSYFGRAGSNYHEGLVTHRALGSHTSDQIKGGDPWKIYNDTIIVGRDTFGGGAGHEYVYTPFYPNIPHEVYNNIIVQTADHYLAREVRVSDGSQIHDGNLYFRSSSSLSTPLFYLWRDGSSTQSFNRLSDFKNSQFFTDSKRIYPPGFENFGIEADPEIDREYRPAADNPAATGAIDLSLKGWPGVDGGIYRGALTP